VPVEAYTRKMVWDTLCRRMWEQLAAVQPHLGSGTGMTQNGRRIREITA